MTPRQVVAELDRYIVGQGAAKRAVAIALRDRWRRSQLDEKLREEVSPKNILMIGSTGVGKTEIARRLAKLVNAPFLKVEATKFTEVGYVGRDVESIIRDITQVAVNQVRTEEEQRVRGDASDRADQRLVDLLLPGTTDDPTSGASDNTRERFVEMLREGRLEERTVEIEVPVASSAPRMEMPHPQGMEDMDLQIRDLLGNFLPKRTERRLVTVAEAREHLLEEEATRLVDSESVRRTAVKRVEESGIIFLDEIDKVAGRESGASLDVSREGVQRDILPILEGSNVHTRHGQVSTDHILFIAAGAFHGAKPSDLIPELQGRLPIRVELDDLGVDEFCEILRASETSPLKQSQALLQTEGVTLEFTDDGVEAIAAIAAKVNDETENIGARRLHTVIERLLDEISFEAPDMHGVTVKVDRAMVMDKLGDIVEDTDLSRFIL